MVDLDDVAWPSLECSSGSATVVADLLRAAADPLGDADSLDEIADQLAYELNDGGVLQPAALPAVPHLVDLTVSRPTPRLLLALADLVPPRIEEQRTRQIGQEFDNLPPFVDPLRGPVARAVGERLDDLLPLLGHVEAPVRLMVARLLAGLPEHAEMTVPALRGAAEREPDPAVRASIVLAVGALATGGLDAATRGGPQVLPWLRQVAAEGGPSSDGAALIRVAAAVSVGWVGSPRALGTAEAAVLRATAATPPAELDDEFVWSRDGVYPFLRSASPDDERFAIDLMSQGARAPGRWNRIEAIGEGWFAMARRRSAPPQVVPELTVFLGDPDGSVRQEAAHIIAWAGEATAMADDVLVDLLGDTTPDLCDGGNQSAPPVAWSALLGLARTASPRCIDQVKRLIADPTTMPPHPNQPFLAVDVLGFIAGHASYLMPVVRECLRAHLDGSGAGDEEHLGDILEGIRAWPDELAQVTEELLVLARRPAWPAPLTPLLGELGPAAAPASDHVRDLLGSPSGATATAAAVALWRITADVSPSLAVLRSLSRGDEELAARHAARAAREMGPAAADLAEDITPLLSSQVRAARVEAARALWSITGDVAASLDTLLAEVQPDRLGMDAIEILAQIGPPARAALPELETMARAAGRIPLRGVRLRDGHRVLIDNQGRDFLVLDERCRDLAGAAFIAIDR